jgi:hypothetical protein
MLGFFYVILSEGISLAEDSISKTKAFAIDLATSQVFLIMTTESFSIHEETAK